MTFSAKYLRVLFFQFVFLCLTSSVLSGQGNARQHITLLFVGDIMQHDAQLEAAYNAKTGLYEYDTYFRYVSPLIRKADIAMANLEVTLAGPPYTGYPQFGAPDALALSLKDAGFDYLITANNHSCDKGLKGINRTIAMLDSFDIPHTGTFRNQKERDETYPLIINKNGFRLALLNYTYGTNGIEVPSPSIVNLIDTAIIRQDIAKAKSQNPDLVIVTLHWGGEYKRLQGKDQESIAAYCFANGADLIIGSHPHVLQPMEKREIITGGDRSSFIAWSMGNFVSNQRKRYTDGGCLLWLEISKSHENKNLEIDKAGYVLSWVYVDGSENRKSYYVLPVIQAANPGFELNIDKTSMEAMNLFAEDSRQLLNTHNLGVIEMNMDTLLWQKKVVVAGRQIYRIHLQTSSSVEELNSFPDHIRNQIEIVEKGGNFQYYIGRYISFEVANAFLEWYIEQGYTASQIELVFLPMENKSNP